MNRAELKGTLEALIFVSDEPIKLKQLIDLLPEEEPGEIEHALLELVEEFNGRESGLEIREIASGWRISTRPCYHEYIRAYLKTKPSAKLSLAALETLAVIAYKQPVTIPEILEIRGVSSSSAIKTLLDRRLIVPRGRKDCVGRPVLYATSKEFLIQFGLKDLSELPTIEDFDELVAS